MEVIAYKLVPHAYDEESLNAVYAPNELKRKDFEWNRKTRHLSPVCKELDKYDIAFNISNIADPDDDYGYCFLNQQQLPDGSYVYTMEQVVLDTGLPEFIIRSFFSSVVQFLTHININCPADVCRVDKLICKGTYSLNRASLGKTKTAVRREIYNAFLASRSGQTSITEEQELRLKEIAASLEKRQSERETCNEDHRKVERRSADSGPEPDPLRCFQDEAIRNEGGTNVFNEIQGADSKDV
jgi:hypothetical protein